MADESAEAQAKGGNTKTIYPAIFNTPPTNGQSTTDTTWEIHIGISSGAPQWPQDTVMHHTLDGNSVDTPVSDRKNDFTLTYDNLAVGTHEWYGNVTGTDVHDAAFSPMMWNVVAPPE